MHDSETTRPVRRVVIAGGGTAGWMVAAALGRTLGRVLDITLIESDEIGTVGVGEATIPTLVTFHRLLELDEREVMAATQATFKLGISFENWRGIGEDYIHSFGTTGQDHWTAGFQHFWLKGRRRGLAGDYGDYCLELRASVEDRFAHLPRGGMNYAFHLDAGLYARYLRRFSEGLGVKRVEGKIASVDADRGAQRIDALTLTSGERIEGDLFVDCTGFRGLLLGETLGIEMEDWSQWLHCDRAVALQTEHDGDRRPLTRAIAHEAGWRWRIALQHRVGNGLVYSSRHLDDDAAVDKLVAMMPAKVLTAPRVIRFKPCQREATWVGNCIGIGLASGFLEPIESTSIHLIQRGVIRLLQMFPNTGIDPHDVAEYNAQTRHEVEHIRDFIILHYHVNRRQEPFWRACREMSIPASLQHRIDLFRETGRVFRVPNELFTENSWIQVMLGQGIEPKTYHPSADLMGDAELSHFLGRIRDGIEKTVAPLPKHADYVRTYCPTADVRQPA